MAGAGICNAVLDPILIFGFGPVPAFGIQGAAMASVASWATACAVILYILGVKRRLIHYWPHSWQLTFRGAMQICNIGLPAAGANMLTPLAMAIMTAIAG